MDPSHPTRFVYAVLNPRLQACPTLETRSFRHFSHKNTRQRGANFRIPTHTTDSASTIPPHSCRTAFCYDETYLDLFMFHRYFSDTHVRAGGCLMLPLVLPLVLAPFCRPSSFRAPRSLSIDAGLSSSFRVSDMLPPSSMSSLSSTDRWGPFLMFDFSPNLSPFPRPHAHVHVCSPFCCCRSCTTDCSGHMTDMTPR